MSKEAFKFISCIEQTDGSIDIIIPAAMNKEFKELVKRAINTWPDQSQYIREFADRLFKQHHLMNGNMLDEINKFDRDLSREIKKAPKKLCEGHPETCNCPQHG